MRRRNVEERRREEDQRLREELFRQALISRGTVGARRRQQHDRQGDALRNKAEKTTEMLNSLVQRMGEQAGSQSLLPERLMPCALFQVRQSEESTTTLIHSSNVLRETHSHF